MNKTFFAIKQNMTQAWDKQGRRLAITKVLAAPAKVTQVKSHDVDGYHSIQIGFGTKSVKGMTNPYKGHLKLDKKAEVGARYLREIHAEVVDEVSVGDVIDISKILKVGDIVSASSLMKGRGFAGVMKRWGFGGGPRTHGQSDRARAPGSIGQGTDPGRVHKGKKMAGHYGNVIKTVKNLQVLRIDEDGMVWLSGTLPGSRGSLVKLTWLYDGVFEGLKIDDAPKQVTTDLETVNVDSEEKLVVDEVQTDTVSTTEEVAEEK